eukprot:1142918-Pelagomonas_calceolata.AAC.1
MEAYAKAKHGLHAYGLPPPPTLCMHACVRIPTPYKYKHPPRSHGESPNLYVHAPPPTSP